MTEMKVPPAKMERTSENQEDFNYSQHIFYTESAHTTVLLQDGKTLSFNKEILCHMAQSPVLYNMFFGPLKDNEATKITDVDYNTFKLFLDCIVGYEPYIFENCMEIFPVVWKYQIESAIEKCVAALKPTEMDESVCHVLNMASLCTCEKLVKEILAFISTYNSYKFIEDERYCHLLTPDSIKLVISELSMDSYLLDKIVKWGEHFIKNNNQFGDSVQELFQKADILKYFQLEKFETTGALYNFRLTETGKKIFPSDEVLTYLQYSENLTHRNSKWDKKENRACLRAYIEEEIHFPVRRQQDKIKALIEIESNKFVYYEAPKPGRFIECLVDLIGKDYSGKRIFTKTSSFEVTDSESDKAIISYEHDCSHNSRKIEKLTVRLTWFFQTDCRVLLTNKPGDELNRDMYFAKNVTIGM